MKLVASGKVRELYEVDSKTLLLVASDRISAYDCIMTTEIPRKGIILTTLSNFWFSFLKVPNHLLTGEIPKEFEERAVLVKKLEILPVEAIVRGYLTGSAWSEYKVSQTVHGIKMKPGMVLNQKFDKPLFTPSTKAKEGHDENIHPDVLKEMIGEDLAKRVEEFVIDIYSRAYDEAFEKGIIIADSKFELGLQDGELILADEVLTPDSSRFWARETYKIGEPQDRYARPTLVLEKRIFT